ncbi:MAG: hypothetical protein WEB03_15155 [Nitriliruptor sp.]|uniref:hypothetical protein n=1 Tax=Nitriliruptor sp. TaxID=2448056 RepID=UPI00349FEAB3
MDDPTPQDPVEADVDLAVAAQQRLGETLLARSDEPTRRCGLCRHYLNPGHDLALCWHPDQRCLVDADWVCRAFEGESEG